MDLGSIGYTAQSLTLAVEEHQLCVVF